jgi:rSAM/selenodomain-associated transferase 2
MRPSATVIIPAFNEEARIAAAIDSAFAAGAAEVLVADGRSDDRTAAIARERGARVLACERLRARQLNRGADAASHELLLFLHADTILPIGAVDAARQALAGGAHFGGFRIAFAERAWKLRLAAALINLRTAITRCPWGDQAQFLRRETFLAAGRFREIPLMEDYEFAARMRRRRGRTAIVPLAVTTSARRFLDKGMLRTAWINWEIIRRFRRGDDPALLAKRYRSR